MTRSVCAVTRWTYRFVLLGTSVELLVRKIADTVVAGRGILRGMDFLHFHWGAIAFWVIKLLKIFGIIPGAIAAGWVRKLYQKRRQTSAMEGWPSTQATIQSGKVHTEGRHHWAELTYSYFVGEYFSGTYVKNFRKEDDADEFVRQVREKQLPVHYRQSKPETSVILDRDLEMIVLMVPQFR